MGYWQTAGNVVCEVDALEGKVVPESERSGLYPTNVDDIFYNVIELGGQYPVMALPDEDDANL